ncbi:DUF2169 family type VI secretion system accessory protein [Neptunicella marina]|uniref:DUF2169 domain-containing protein n=1 Tax=Neptunicella marina TaxID=2125989 RepID=A0A8J6M2T1_9ALTE|nr:DUF2169 domain-containing protein [Neptunicella marina]MBC3766673.1 DUF2169 domain-containing protein [Neptunicella marina]
MLQPPNHSVTLVVKGCFDLVPDNKAVYAQNSDDATITGDTFVDDKPTASLKYANDLVIFKPKADLTLTGVAYPECGKAGCKVTFAVGSWKKSLAIFNDRFWQWGRASKPEPFGAQPCAAIPLTYENAYGGLKYAQNPVGKGLDKIDVGTENLHPLPNIEHCDAYLSSPSQKSLPAGFGPLKDGWGDKTPLSGTYNDKWLKQNFPYFPNDFNWRYFNNAPQDQQVDYLTGDESLYFEHLRPEVPHFNSKLPAIRPRLFVKGQYSPEQRFFHEVTLHLDTLHVDMEKQQINLIWRGVVGVQSDEFEELQHACLFVENMDGERCSSDYYQQEFEQHQNATNAEFAIEEFEDPQGEDLPLEVIQTTETETFEASTDTELKQHFEHLKQQLKELGLADNLLELFNPDADVDKLNKQIFQAQHINPDDGAKLIESSKQDMLTFLKDQGYDLPEFHSASSQGVNLKADTEPSLVTQPNVKGTELTGLDLSNQDLSNRDFRHADLSNAILTGANLSGSDFSDADLSDCIMNDVQAVGAIFDGAILTGVSAEQANFTKISAVAAQFQQASLMNVDLSEAELNQADFTATNLPGANFNKTLLQESIFDDSDLSQARFIQIDAKSASFAGSNLYESTFNHCNLREVNFSNCHLSLAKFEQSELSNALMENVDAKGLSMFDCGLNGIRAAEGSNFSNAYFVKGSAIAIIFDGADLTDAIFEQIPLQSADLSSTDLTRTIFNDCDLKLAEFAKSTATETKLSGVNLFQANFTKSKLTRTDLSRSNLYGAEFYQANIDNVDFNHANIKQTKIALGMVK